MKPGEHKTVQARILEYAQAIGWTVVPRKEAEQRRGLKEWGFNLLCGFAIIPGGLSAESR